MAFRPTRLVIARQRRRHTKQTVARSAGLTLKGYDQIEAGKAEPLQETAERLASALQFPLPFFFTDEIDRVAAERVSFRSMAAMSDRLRDSVLASAAIAFTLNKKIENTFHLPVADLPDLAGEAPAAAAEFLRAHWGVGVLAIRNMVHLLEAHGVRVFSLAEDCREVDAFAVWDAATPYVFLNTLKSAEHGRWDAAHELGHLVLHRSTESRGKEAEEQANQFAAAFLMPECNIRSLYGMPSASDLVRHKHKWGVSVTALARRLHSIGVMPDFYYRRLMIEISRRGWRTSEPEGLPRESSLLFEKVFGLWREHGMGPSAIAEQLHLTADELSGLVFGRILHTLNGQGGTTPPPRPMPALRLIR